MKWGCRYQKCYGLAAFVSLWQVLAPHRRWFDPHKSPNLICNVQKNDESHEIKILNKKMNIFANAIT